MSLRVGDNASFVGQGYVGGYPTAGNITGSGTATYSAYSASGSGTVSTAITGSGTATYGAYSASGSGTVSTAITGSGTATYSAYSASGSGTVVGAPPPVERPSVAGWLDDDDVEKVRKLLRSRDRRGRGVAVYDAASVSGVGEAEQVVSKPRLPSLRGHGVARYQSVLATGRGATWDEQADIEEMLELVASL